MKQEVAGTTIKGGFYTGLRSVLFYGGVKMKISNNCYWRHLVKFKPLPICLLMPLVLSSFSAASDELFFVDVNAHPLSFYDEQRQVQGVAIEIFKKVMDNLGHKTVLELLPGKRVIHMLKNGQADGVPFIRKTSKRETYLDYSQEALLYENVYFYVNKGHEFDFNGDFSAIKQKKIAIILGDTHGDIFNKIAVNLNLVETITLDSSFSMLLKKRVDMVVSTAQRASKILETLPSGKIVRIMNPMESIPLYAAFTKKRRLSLLRDQFDRELKELKRSGFVKSIVDKWQY